MSPLQVKTAGTFVPVGGSSSAWVRPSDWLTLPTLVVGEQKFVGLVAVFPGDSNWVNVQTTTACTVDWGDGSAPENFASATKGTHNYTWASVSGTTTTEGFRQAIVTITPQAGQTITTYTFGGTITGVSTTPTLWLDMAFVGSAINGIALSTIRSPSMLQQFSYVGPSAITSCSSFFAGCRSLRSIVGTEWFDGVTNASSMFSNCVSLTATHVPILDTSTVTDFTSMFNNCNALTTIPLLDTSSGLNFSSMFTGCASLQTVPALNVAAGTNFSSMFNTCAVLKTIPALNVSAGINFTSMFNNCAALQSIPALNVANGTDFTTMFAACAGLQSSALVGTSRSITYACKLSAAQLDAIYTALASGVTAQTITVTGNWGNTADTPSIATAKGWTVTG